MEKLKTYITFNLCSIYGYCILPELAQLIYSYNIKYNIFYSWAGLFLDIMSFVFLFCCISAFCIELFLRFIIKKIWKKDFKLHFDNKIYNFLFRLGIFFIMMFIAFLLSNTYISGDIRDLTCEPGDYSITFYLLDILVKIIIYIYVGLFAFRQNPKVSMLELIKKHLTKILIALAIIYPLYLCAFFYYNPNILHLLLKHL